jgi:PAS domain S-box-containing protein
MNTNLLSRSTWVAPVVFLATLGFAAVLGPARLAAWGAAAGAAAMLVVVCALVSQEVLRRASMRSGAAALGVIDGIQTPAFVVAHDGTIAAANRRALALGGAGPTVTPGSAFCELFEGREAALDALDKARGRGAVREVSLALIGANGAARDVTLSASLIEEGGEGPRRVLAILDDVTETRAAEAQARERADYARSLIEASVDPLFAINPEGKITDVNEATIAKAGVTREALVGVSFAGLFSDPELARQGYERVLSDGKVQDYPLTFVHRNGTKAYVAFNASRYLDEKGALVGIFAQARDVTQARKLEVERNAKEWVMTGVARLNAVFQSQGETRELCRRIITELAEYAGAQVGAFYVQDAEGDGSALTLVASHAYTRRKGVSNRYLPGEGIVGQAALERKQVLLSRLPDDYIQIASGLGEASPRSLCVTPLLFDGAVRGMVELASFEPLSDDALEYVKQAAPTVAIALDAAAARERVAAALSRAQQLAAELEAQQDTLRNANAELEEQTAQLKLSDQKMKAQQSEIELANATLNEKNALLERQRNETEEARRSLAAQAEEVALASKYKSEFLANMSHELRTPLNSLLLLARSLRDNGTGNLTGEQVESAGVIFDSGSDLLNLINEILDLSKIEAGKMELRPEEIELADLTRTVVSQFDHMARAQGLALTVQSQPDAPERIVSDPQRLGQVMRNLLGNALKFTEAGSVTVTFGRPAPTVNLARSGLEAARSLVVHVRDTGIGIPADKQKIIFEAFQQADSGDRRRYGGTGLGLSISRELVSLLQGEIQLESEPGRGSTFSVYLPLDVTARGAQRAEPRAPAPPRAPAAQRAVPAAPRTPPTPAPVADDRGNLAEHDRVILVIEDDLRFGKVLAGYVRERGFKCLQATTGEEGIELARAHKPHGVVLDIQLPGIDGWAVLGALKQDVSLRHIPVHIVSVEESSTQTLRIGAIGHAAKPIGREQIEQMLQRLESASAQASKRVLVVEDDELMRRETVRIVGTGNVSTVEVGTGREALEALRGEPFNLVVMDLGLPDMQGMELLKRAAAERIALPPVIIHTVRELTVEEEFTLRNYSDSIIVKDVRSQERLIDEVALFLHRVVRDLPEENRRAILNLRESDEPLRGKKVLIVEDDMRTVFAMSRMLAGHGVNPIKAENGERALALVDEHPDVDLVLMDMMMPVMDGYEACRRLRAQPRFARLPIIALTAKAMREDRQRCLEAGASDYLTKPVDPERLASLMRVLLCR